MVSFRILVVHFLTSMVDDDEGHWWYSTSRPPLTSVIRLALLCVVPTYMRKVSRSNTHTSVYTHKHMFNDLVLYSIASSIQQQHRTYKKSSNF